MRFFGCENCALITSDLTLPLWYSSVLSVIEDGEICPLVVYSAPGDVSLFSVVNHTKKLQTEGEKVYVQKII